MVCTKSPIGLRRRTAAFCVARAVARGNLVILASWVALDQGEQAAFVSGADDGVAFPVSQAGFARDDGWTLGNVDSIGDQAASSVLAGTFVVTFPAPPKTAPQVATIAFVIPDHLVDAFMAQLDGLFA